jgi:hypothetical protein
MLSPRWNKQKYPVEELDALTSDPVVAVDEDDQREEYLSGLVSTVMLERGIGS